MKYIKLIILATFLSTMFTGCSYVSDYVEGKISDRASFTVSAEYIEADDDVELKWDETDSSDNFAGIEIYRTSKPNDEYAEYELVASRHYTSLLTEGDLSESIKRCRVESPGSSGTFFYRVGIIHVENDEDDNPYNPGSTSDYEEYTDINAVSGYGEVYIP